ncbi:hypothetical protein AFLA_003866 [Aspergillus flavus NRRL3357]|nr:hypothetical protein AFLA_003866 [Aspergillus flavus NRRL3357]
MRRDCKYIAGVKWDIIVYCRSVSHTNFFNLALSYLVDAYSNPQILRRKSGTWMLLKINVDFLMEMPSHYQDVR